MTFNKEELLQDLAELTRINLNEAERLLAHSIEQLNQREAEGKWSVLECMEHLNRYGDFYIPEITSRISKATSANETHFKSGVLGNYFSEMMKPRPKLNTMKTFAYMNPSGSTLDKSTLEKFIHQQKQILELLNSSRDISLQNTKTAISISKLIKLRLGDTFRVVIYHNDRHIKQAQRALEYSQVVDSVH
jgi:hypothetical protein